MRRRAVRFRSLRRIVPQIVARAPGARSLMAVMTDRSSYRQGRNHKASSTVFTPSFSSNAARFGPTPLEKRIGRFHRSEARGERRGTEPVQYSFRAGESALALHQRKIFIIIIEELPEREQIRFHPGRVN